jgi:YHS domain-containing protein
VAALVVVVGCSGKAEPPKSPATTSPVAGHEAMKMGESPAAPAAAGTEIAQKLCPVTGDPIDPKVYLDHNGRRVYFCCSMCEATFKKDPAKYLKIVDDQIKAAATK